MNRSFSLAFLLASSGVIGSRGACKASAGDSSNVDTVRVRPAGHGMAVREGPGVALRPKIVE